METGEPESLNETLKKTSTSAEKEISEGDQTIDDDIDEELFTDGSDVVKCVNCRSALTGEIYYS